MTSRAGRPDTDADRQLRGVLNQRQLTSFVMVAGAGSGKTTSLVKAIGELMEVRGSDLRRHGQKVVCITYTDVAVNEILGDVGGTTSVHVSTIHSFLWTVVQPFQSDLRAWVESRIGEKIDDAQERLAKPGTRPNTREKLTYDIARYEAQRLALSHVTRFTYGTGSDYENGILGHDDVLKIGPALIGIRPLLRTLIAKRYPFIFIDESQDTNPEFIDALRLIAEAMPNEFCLGFFGDPMQKIYTNGAGPIALGNGWTHITKPENFRCPATVLRVINRIRAEDDGLEQVGGRIVERDGAIQQLQGSARLFILPADDRRSERLAEVRHWLAAENVDPHWIGDDKEADVRVLVLVHRMAARRLGFASIYAALNDNGSSSLKDGLLDGTAWVLRPFMSYILPLLLHLRSGAAFDVMAMLRAKCPLLQQARLVGQNAAELLARLRTDVARLSAMFEDGASIQTVLALIRDRELAILDSRFDRFLNGEANAVDPAEARSYDEAVNAFLASPASELWGYRDYVVNQSPFATQQGIKGAEFQRVLVVLDDEEGAYNLFSYGKYFGITALSNTDTENIAAGADSVISRTRRLFYVCCSRAIKDLAVVWFVADVRQALRAALAKDIFLERDIHLIGE